MNNLPDHFSLKDLFGQLVNDPFFEDPFSSLLDQSEFRVDLFDVGDEVVIEAELEGFEKSNIQIHDYSNGLKISAKDEREVIETNEKEQYTHQQKSVKTVERFIQLNFNYDASDIYTSFKDGILEIRIPKS